MEPTFTITPTGPAARAELVALSLARSPHLTEAEAGWFFDAQELFRDRVALVARNDKGTALGFGWTGSGTHMPVGWASMRVVVSSEHEGQGIGSALHARLVARVPDTAVQVRSGLRDDDARTLAVAEHWGFEIDERSIASVLVLEDLPSPAPGPGVVLEDVSDFDFPDRDAVEEMLQRSQTNPEARDGGALDLTRLSQAPAGVPRVAVLARVDGEPAGISCGSVEDGELYISYTGVEPRFRGRGLAVLIKQQTHLDAAARGASKSQTDNEEHNAGIRRINAELGYVVRHGVYFMRQRL